MGQREILVSVSYLPTHVPAGGDDLLLLLLRDVKKKVHALNVLPTRCWYLLSRRHICIFPEAFALPIADGPCLASLRFTFLNMYVVKGRPRS